MWKLEIRAERRNIVKKYLWPAHSKVLIQRLFWGKKWGATSKGYFSCFPDIWRKVRAVLWFWESQSTHYLFFLCESLCSWKLLKEKGGNPKNKKGGFSDWVGNGTKTKNLVSKLDETCISSCSPFAVSISYLKKFNHLSYPQGNKGKYVTSFLGENFKGEVMSLPSMDFVVVAVG